MILVLRHCDQFFQGRGVPRFSYCCVMRNKVESGAERWARKCSTIIVDPSASHWEHKLPLAGYGSLCQKSEDSIDHLGDFETPGMDWVVCGGCQQRGFHSGKGGAEKYPCGKCVQQLGCNLFDRSELAAWRKRVHKPKLLCYKCQPRESQAPRKKRKRW